MCMDVVHVCFVCMCVNYICNVRNVCMFCLIVCAFFFCYVYVRYIMYCSYFMFVCHFFEGMPRLSYVRVCVCVYVMVGM